MDLFTLVKWLNPNKIHLKSGCIFPIFLKLNVQSIIFAKFFLEIEAAAICFGMERGGRKSQQSSRIRVRAQVKLVYPIRNLSDSSKSLDDR